MYQLLFTIQVVGYLEEKWNFIGHEWKLVCKIYEKFPSENNLVVVGSHTVGFRLNYFGNCTFCNYIIILLSISFNQTSIFLHKAAQEQILIEHVDNLFSVIIQG